MKLNKTVVSVIIVLVTLACGGAVATATGVLKWGGEKNIKEIENVIFQLDKKLTSKEAAMTDSTNSISKLQAKLTDAENKLIAAKNELSQAQALIKQKDGTIAQRDQEIQAKFGELAAKDQQIQEKINEGNDKVHEKMREIEEIRKQLEAKQTDSQRLKNEVVELRNKISTYEVEKYESDTKLHQALQDVEQLKTYANTVNQRHPN